MTTINQLGIKFRELPHLVVLTIIFTLAYLSNQFVLIKTITPIKEDFISMQLTYDLEKFLEIIQQWSALEMEAFYRHFIYDSYHPIIYGFALAFSIALAFNFKKINNNLSYFVILPFLSTICDIAENILHYLYVSNPAEITANMIMFSSAFSYCKWITAGICLSLIVFTYAGVMSIIFSSPK